MCPALVCAKGPEQRGDNHHDRDHSGLLLPLLAHRHPVSDEPPLWTPAEERHHLVSPLLLGMRCYLAEFPVVAPPSPTRWLFVARSSLLRSSCKRSDILSIPKDESGDCGPIH